MQAIELAHIPLPTRTKFGFKAPQPGTLERLCLNGALIALAYAFQGLFCASSFSASLISLDLLFSMLCSLRGLIRLILVVVGRAACGIDDEGVQALIAILPKLTALSYLDLRDNPISQDCKVELSIAVAQSPGVRLDTTAEIVDTYVLITFYHTLRPSVATYLLRFHVLQFYVPRRFVENHRSLSTC